MRKFRRNNIKLSADDVINAECVKTEHATISFLEILELVRGMQLKLLDIDQKLDKLGINIESLREGVTNSLNKFPEKLFTKSAFTNEFIDDYFNHEIDTMEFYTKYKKYAIIRED